MGDEMRLCDVVFHYALVRPNGTVHSVSGPRIVWDRVSPPNRTVQLAEDKLVFRFDERDPPGRYMVHILVRDRIRKIDIDLERPVVLIE